MITTIANSTHTALLDVLTGEGLLVLPNPADDVRDPLSPLTLHWSGWHDIVRTLDGMGWEPSEDDDGLPLPAGETLGGRPIVGLYGCEPVHEERDLERLARASADLLAAARHL